jgi:streptomycin 3"-adenylyltransferase
LLESLPGDTRNVLLTLARIWTTLATGTIVSKDDAASWVLGRLAPERRPALEYARRLYLTTSYADETWSDALQAEVGPCVDEIVAQIQLAASGTHRSRSAPS